MKYIYTIFILFCVGCGTTIETRYITIPCDMPKLYLYEPTSRPDVTFYPIEDKICTDKDGMVLVLDYIKNLENNLNSCNKQINIYNDLKTNLEEVDSGTR